MALAVAAVLFSSFARGAPPAAAPAPPAAEDPGESTFRRQVRTQWFAWLAALEEGDTALGRAKADEILKFAQRFGIRRLSDLALAATVYGRQKARLGKPEIAREAFDSAVRFDPDLPEIFWNQLSVSLATRRFGEAPGEIVSGIRATFADATARRITLGRGAVLLAIAGAALGVAMALLVVAGGARRLLHDTSELTGRVLPAPARTVAAVALLTAPLILSFDVLWFLLLLFVLAFGYATPWQKIGSAIAILLVLPLLPVLDRVAYRFDLDASPIVRGADALHEARYDQRVLDGLEAAKNILPDDADVRFLLGRLYQLYGQYDRATAEYSMVAQMSAADSRGLVNRGALRFADGDFGSAQEDFQAAVRRDARNVTARYNLSLVYAETFQTTEAAAALNEARAIDSRSVQRFQDSPRLVKVVTMDYGIEEARAKAAALTTDSRGRRLTGQFRDYGSADALRIPFLWALAAGAAAAFGIDAMRARGRGYAQTCQKCGRTFCRRCKPPGESALLCSQCVHVYLRKDGVAIETKLQKVEEVKRRRTLEDRMRLVLNLFVPGAAAFGDGRLRGAILSMSLFFLGLAGAFLPSALGVTPRPGDTQGRIALALWLVVAAAGWVLGQFGARRKAAVG